MGINLAMTELYLTIGMLFRRFSFDVSAVDRERDIDVSRDFVLVANRFDSRGVFVRVGSVEE